MPIQNNPEQGKPKKLLDLVRDSMRTHHYSFKTEKSYINWMKRYIFFHNKRHPNTMGAKEIKEKETKTGSYLCLIKHAQH